MTLSRTSPTLKLRFIPSGGRLTPPSRTLHPHTTARNAESFSERTTWMSVASGTLQWKLHDNGRPFSYFALEPDGSIEVLNDLLCNCESDSHSVGFRGEAWLEDLLLQLWRNAAARVA